ncbi:MAG: molybdenum cofactor guanylyltransferase [Acidimicrobiales bacterium]
MSGRDGGARAAGAGGTAGVAGVLLTGGGSKRMGFDKSLMRVAGLPNAVRLAQVLGQVASPVVEVGPGRTDLPAAAERPQGSGPLAALAAGATFLCRRGSRLPVVVVACDMPFLSATTLGFIAGYPGGLSVVPLVGGSLQPLCARWSQGDLQLAAELVEAGERSMKALLGRADFVALGPDRWPGWMVEDAFVDLDTPEDLETWSLRRHW